jgi:hypothetical protein
VAISFPTSLDNFSNPASTDSLNTPSHSLQHTDLNDAVEALEAKLGIGASPAGSATSGQVLTAGTAGTTTWQTPAADNNAWTSYTPNWTNLTIGNATVDAKYKQIGKTVFVKGTFTFGSTTSITGTGPTMSLPVTNFAASPNVLGHSNMTDLSAGQIYAGQVRPSGTTAVEFRYFQVSGTLITASSQITSTGPMTWTTSDSINVNFYYEVA